MLESAIENLDWDRISAQLDENGYATTGPLLNPTLCTALSATYDQSQNFRSRIVMARHGFGRGEYQYFAYPLPAPVQTLRAALYPHLAPLANRWRSAMDQPADYPPHHDTYLALCHSQSQTRPTPLLLRYGPGDYNCLHQDLYGDLSFPMQAAFLLDRTGEDFTGGEFVLTEQRPRRQSRAEVVTLQQGEAVIFAVNQRPMRGACGTTRVAMRHAVSTLQSGKRHTLGIIFHDAR